MRVPQLFILCVHVCPLKLELYVLMSHPTWLLGTKFQSSIRIASTLNCQTIIPVPTQIIL